MKTVKAWSIASILGLGLIMFSLAAQAQQAVQLMGCSTGKRVILSESEYLTVYSIVGDGPAWGSAGITTYKNLTWDFLATIREMDGQTIGIGYCKFTDGDGDYFILEATGEAVAKGGEWKLLHGTGKWSGLAGGLRGRVVFQGRPLAVETEKYWCRILGTLDLPK